MKIRRVDISNFRGVRSLSWKLPIDQTFFVLIGPGDATKSTILTAIERGLSDRWNVTFADTDFYNGNIEEPIRIRVALSDLPPDLLSLDELGLHLAGIDANGQWVHDAEEDGYEACVIVELRVDGDLEPQWVTYRPGGDEEPAVLKARHRARFGAFRVDERVDAHLRWSRMSALGKLTEKKGDTKSTLTLANRSAQKAVAEAVPPGLQSLADEVAAAVRAIGTAEFRDLRPGLDLSLASAQGNLALFDGSVPLTNFGLGTRRLAGTAAQQLAHENAAILLVDEVEYGLEPHRLVHLLRHLRNKDAFAQVFVTTHSPTALQHLEPSDLLTVRSTSGTTSVGQLVAPKSLIKVIKRCPEAFLARRVVVCEGKTEYGLLLALLETWDHNLDEEGKLPSAALGVVSVEGDGGTGSVGWALQLLGAGYDVILFLDSDDEAANARVGQVTKAGGKVVQWPGRVCIEQAVCNELSAAGLTAFIAAAVAVAENNVDDAQLACAQQLQTKGAAPATETPLDVSSWLGEKFTLDGARTSVGLAANKSSWFKRVDRGRALADLILGRPELSSGAVAATIAELRGHIYHRPKPPADLDPSGVSNLVRDGAAEGEGTEE